MLNPRENSALYGFDALELAAIEQWKTGKLPHALLLSGPRGVGKATFAYRLARFILAEGETADALFGPQDLSMDEEHPIFQRVASGSHSNLRIIEPGGEGVKPAIKVDDIREMNESLMLTAAQDGWRVIIIDSADDMNMNAANALLKNLEEPPEKTIFILISHNSGQLLPTIESRCRKWRMSAHSKECFNKITQYIIPGMDDRTLNMLYALSNGSPGFACQLYEHNAMTLYETMTEAVATIPNIGSSQLSALSNYVKDRKNPSGWQHLIHCFDIFFNRLHKKLLAKNDSDILTTSEDSAHRAISAIHAPEQLLKLHQDCLHWLQRGDQLNNDRQQLVASVFHALNKQVRLN